MDQGDVIDAARMALGAAGLVLVVALLLRLRRPADRGDDLVAGPVLRALEGRKPGAVGAWIHLAAAGPVVLTVEWETGVPPAIHLANLHGHWHKLAERPSRSGASVAVRLPAGPTWVEVIPATPRTVRASTAIHASKLATAPAVELSPPW